MKNKIIFKNIIAILLTVAFLFAVAGCSSNHGDYTIKYANGKSEEMTFREFKKWQKGYTDNEFNKILRDNIIVGSGTVEKIYIEPTSATWPSKYCQVLKVVITLDTDVQLNLHIEVPNPGYAKPTDENLENVTTIEVGDKITYSTIGEKVTTCDKIKWLGYNDKGGFTINLGIKLEHSDNGNLSDPEMIITTGMLQEYFASQATVITILNPKD